MGIFTDLTKFSEHVNLIYEKAIDDYHVQNSIHTSMLNPYEKGDIESLFYSKCWTDTVQWHVEDEIRNPYIQPEQALKLKRRIDHLNQERTDKVELIDHCFLLKYSNVKAAASVSMNTESPAWALDRLSILALKIYHMKAEAERTDAIPEHIASCGQKLSVLYEQQKDLLRSINELLQDISGGRKHMKVYKQMKMYNDPALNPVLYNASR
jgi:hypothetical protein